MTKLLRLACASLIALAAVMPAQAASERVILISWDGMRHDYPDLMEYPALSRLEAGGIRTRLIPPDPSNTFPGHVTLATGAPPFVHGVLDNRMYDRIKGEYAYSADASWINAEPVWIAVERQGKRAATYFWVGSETDWRGSRATYRETPFDTGRPEAEKARKIIEWLDLPADERPALIMSYWRGADSVAHSKGADHPAVAQVIKEQDAVLGDLLAAIDARDLWPTTTLLLVSDHGMAAVRRAISLRKPLSAAGVKARITGGTTVKRVFLNRKEDMQRALATLREIDDVTVYAGDAIPAALRFPNRTGDIVVTTGPPNALAEGRGLLERLAGMLGASVGGHGYDPNHPDMAAIFYAYGAGVKPGKEVGTLHADQVAATVTRLLGLEAPQDAVGQPVPLGGE